MQLKCGQCGKRHRIRAAEVSWAECDACRHRIFIGHLTQGVELPEIDPKSLFETDTEFSDALRKAIRERMIVLCGNCGGRMKVAKRMAGQKTRCPNCSTEVMIPVQEEESLFDDSYLPDERAELTATAPEVQKALQQMHLHEHYVENPVDKKSLMTKSIIAAAAVLLLAGIWLAVILMTETPQTEAEDPLGGKTVVTPIPEPKPINPTPTPKPAPADLGRASLHSAYSGSFAAGGYLPAPPGQRYLAATIDLKTGDASLDCKNFGPDVKLEIHEKTYFALGEALPEKPALPLPARRGRLVVPPKSRRTATFIFLLPSRGGTGELTIGSLPVMPLTLSNAYEPVNRWDQKFIEISPRSLKPLLEHPVMAAIQATPRPTLVIQRDRRGLLISIPEAGVQGRAAMPKRNLCQVNLNKGQSTLPVKLYWVQIGEKLVLSLADQPMHQIVFMPQNAKEKEPEPDDGPPTFFGS